jgi:fatty-acyl-CoA synthase
VIIDGRNHYPQDIEATTAEASPTVRRDTTAFSVPANEMPGSDTADTTERLVIIAERAPGTGRSAAGDRGDQAAVLHRHGLPVSDVRFLPAGAIPHHQRQAGSPGLPRPIS